MSETFQCPNCSPPLDHDGVVGQLAGGNPIAITITKIFNCTLTFSDG